MKILLCTHQFLPDFFAGTEILTFNTAIALKKMGHEVRVLTSYPLNSKIHDDERFDEYVYQDIPVFRFMHNYVPMGDQRNIFEMEFNNQFLAKNMNIYLSKWKPDVVHVFNFIRLSVSIIDTFARLQIPVVYTATDFWSICIRCQLRHKDHSLCSGPSLLSLNCLKHILSDKCQGLPEFRMFKGFICQFLLKTILIIHHGFSLSAWSAVTSLLNRQRFIKKRLNQIDKILVPTNLMGKLLKKNGIKGSQIRFQSYGIDLSPFENSSTVRGDCKELRIGFIGSISEHKGVHLLIKSVLKIPKEISLELKIYGNLNLLSEYDVGIQRLASQDRRIKFCGTFPNQEIAKIISGIDVLVVPSLWYENAPLVIYSAQADRCPVIAANLGGMAELIEHEVNGLLFNKGDIIQLSTMIRRLCENRALVKELASHAKQPKSSEQYSVELEMFYNEFIKSKL